MRRDTAQTRTQTPLKRKAIERRRKPFESVKLPNETDALLTKRVTGRELITAHLPAVYAREQSIVGGADRWVQWVRFSPLASDTEWLRAKTNLMKREDTLIDLQGSDPDEYSDSVRAMIDKSLAEGTSPGDIAKDQNLLALAAAIAACDPKVLGDLHALEEEYFVMVLEPFGLKNGEIETYLFDAQIKLKKGQLPWHLTGKPITRNRVNSTVQTHRERMQPPPEDHIKMHRVKYGQHDYTHAADLVWQRYDFLGYLEQAKALLEKKAKDEFDLYLGRYERLVTEIRSNPLYGK